MDSDLVNRAADEREKIFERYDLGRTAAVDPWEDPDYSIYSCVDRFGFVHDNKASASPQEDKKTLEKKLEILVQREKKWIKMLKNWDKKSTKEKLHKRIYKGIPDKVRYSVWEKLLDLEKVMALESNRDVYQRMLIIARRHGTEARQIDSDVNRQFRENIFFRERYNLKQKQMFNVLVAYSMYNSEVGYCQGMSTLAGMLLMYFGEEETFWALNILLTDKKFAMHGLFILGFPKLTRFLAHHDAILTKFLPKLKRHFDQCNLDSILYSLKWFFVVFVERIPFSLCLRVWDIYLYEGERVATAMAYTVLKLHKNKLLKLKDMDSIVHYLQVKLAKDFGYDDDSVIKAYEQCSEELRKAKMELPPPGGELEFPQKPFGVFVEPTREEIIGHRKTDFADIEKEVTGNVIKSREQTALELAENAEAQAIDIGMCGSNSQLNTVQKTESEDGGSMLGSSKRSLAETSVTSTADLSIFSGGERRPASSQQYRNDNVFENNFTANENIIISDIDFNNEAIIVGEDADNGESSPNSMAKSSSTIQVFQKTQSSPPNSESKRNSKNSSTTPTPTISNPDILRIYVPPPPEDPLPDIRKYEQRDRGDDEISQCSNRSSIIHVEYETLSFDRPPPLSSPTNKIDHIHSTNGANKPQHHQPQQYYYYPNPTPISSHQSSSSRRGSMNRKTPSPLLGDLIVECDHMKHRRSQENFQDDSNSIGIKLQQISINNNYNSINNNNGSGSLKRMTSFEEIARKSDSNSLYISEANDNNFVYNSNSSHSNKPRSDYGIYNSYKNLEGEFDQITKNQMIMKKSTSHSYNIRRSSDRKHSSSENNSAFDYDLLKEKKKDHRYNYDGESGRQYDNDNSIKSYDRFFNSDDEMDDDEIKTRSTKRTHHKYRSHISGTEADDDDEENSSNSPTNKSIPCTPLNADTMPLLSNDLEPHMSGYHNIPPPVLPSPATSSASSLRSKSRIPRLNKNKSPGSGFTKNSSVSSPDGSDRSEGFRNHSSVSYQTPLYRSDGKSASDNKGRNASQRSDNKIRIKINQKN